MPRLVIAISVSDEYKTRLDAIAATLGGRLQSRVRWTRPDNWHVTLHFLGQVEDDKVNPIRYALRQIEFPVFSMRADGIGAVPNVCHPRVIWVDMEEGSEACIELAEEVKNVMESFDVKRGKPCIPHLTLGRVKRLECDNFAMEFAQIPQDWPMVRIDKFSLWESELTPNGSIYTVIEEFPLQMESEPPSPPTV